MCRGMLQQPNSIRETSPENPPTRLGMQKLARAFALVFAIVGSIAVLDAWHSDEPEPIPPLPLLPQLSLTPRPQISFQSKNITAEIGRYDNEFDAYNAVSLLRHREVGGKFLVSIGEHGRFIAVRSELPNDLLSAIAEVERLRAAGMIRTSDWAITDPAMLRRWWDESQLFSQMYSDLDPPKASVPAPSSTLIRDLATASAFFDLPIRVFLFDPPSFDRRKALLWQRRPGQGRVVVVRSSGKYLTLPAESVEWQETRTALEHAHRLYVSDHRDYSQLPMRLRPPENFREEVAPSVLLTYACLLLRDLANKSSPSGVGPVDLLATMPDDPNARQELGVRRASLHARRALAHALEVNRECLLDSAASERRN